MPERISEASNPFAACIDYMREYVPSKPMFRMVIFLPGKSFWAAALFALRLRSRFAASTQPLQSVWIVRIMWLALTSLASFLSAKIAPKLAAPPARRCM